MYVPYLSGNCPPPELPLGRFLPPVPTGMATAWTRANVPAGACVLDPFGFSPLIPIELAQAGFPVLVTANNPIHAFLIRILASAPQEAELTAALQDLALAPKGDTRMEPYIRSMYQIQCADCGNTIEADAFLWKKEDQRPFAVLVACPFCGAQGEQLLSEAVLASLTPLPPAHLHQARALNRVAALDDPLRAQVENALNTYPTRPLIILQTIINKLDSLDQSPRRRDLLTALILSAADQGNTLWAYPAPRERPRQIVIPPVYQEKNLWKALEAAIPAWQILTSSVPVVPWEGKLSKEPAVMLFEGRIRELALETETGAFQAVITALPRPNQAFWTLSALWTGWIWGQDAVTPIRNVLGRQRYDWNWHANALIRTIKAVTPLCAPQSKVWGVVTENEPLFLLATLLAGGANGYRLSGYAQSADDQLAQCEFHHYSLPDHTIQPAECLNLARDAVRQFFRVRGEPADYQLVHAAAVTSLAARNALALDIFLQNENQVTSEIQKLLETLFKEPGTLKRVGGGTASLETGDWWSGSPADVQLSHMDRLEKAVVNHLVSQKSTSIHELLATVYQELPGIDTPTHEELSICLKSYADPNPNNEKTWSLRPSEEPAARRTDLSAVRQSLIRIAQRLGYQVDGEAPMIWRTADTDNRPDFSFHILASAIVQRHLQENVTSAQSRIILIPGSRANLLAFKEERNPVLKEQLDRGFIVVKFRLIRNLEDNPLLTRDLFLEQIRVDPPEYRSSQLALF